MRINRRHVSSLARRCSFGNKVYEWKKNREKNELICVEQATLKNWLHIMYEKLIKRQIEEMFTPCRASVFPPFFFLYMATCWLSVLFLPCHRCLVNALTVKRDFSFLFLSLPIAVEWRKEKTAPKVITSPQPQKSLPFRYPVFWFRKLL